MVVEPSPTHPKFNSGTWTPSGSEGSRKDCGGSPPTLDTISSRSSPLAGSCGTRTTGHRKSFFPTATGLINKIRGPHHPPPSLYPLLYLCSFKYLFPAVSCPLHQVKFLVVGRLPGKKKKKKPTVDPDCMHLGSFFLPLLLFSQQQVSRVWRRFAQML